MPIRSIREFAEGSMKSKPEHVKAKRPGNAKNLGHYAKPKGKRLM